MKDSQSFYDSRIEIYSCRNRSVLCWYFHQKLTVEFSRHWKLKKIFSFQTGMKKKESSCKKAFFPLIEFR